LRLTLETPNHRVSRGETSTLANTPAPLKFPPTGALKRNWDKVIRLATILPDVDVDRSYGTPALKTKNKLIARLRSEAEGGLALKCELLDREMLLQADPDAFYITDHYADYPMVLINLAKVRWDAMPGLLEAAWKMSSTKAAIKRFESAP